MSWDNGWWRAATRIESENADERPADVAIDLLVIHYISLPPGYFAGDAIEQLFCNRLDCDSQPAFAPLRGLRVSSHFLIRRHGQLRQFVSINKRAWHAGVSRFGDRQACNDFSIGIEMEGDENRAFTRSQYRRLASLVDALRKLVPLTHVTGHSDIAPGRKFDPGPRFDWQRVMNDAAFAGLKRYQSD